MPYSIRYFLFICLSVCCSVRAESVEKLQMRLQPQFVQIIPEISKENPEAFIKFKQFQQDVKLCIQENPTNFSFQDNIGIVFAKALDDGMGGPTAIPRLHDLRTNFNGNDFSRVRQGIDIIMLEIFYKADRWQDGFRLISNESTNHIVHPQFIAEVEGFCSGAANAGKSKEACEAYAKLISNLSNIQDGIHTPGDCILRLSHTYALNKDQNSRLATLNRIEMECPDYYKKTEPTIHWFKYATYVNIGKQVEAAVELEATAKLLSTSNHYNVSSFILESLPKHVKIYQESGWLSKDLKLQVEAGPNNTAVRKDESSLAHLSRKPLTIMVLISLSTLICMLIIFRRKT